MNKIGKIKMVADNFKKRTLTGAGLVFVITISVVAGPVSFVLLMLAINIFSLAEFYRLFSFPTLMPRKIQGISLSIVTLLTTILLITGTSGWDVLLVNIPAVFAMFFAELYLKTDNPFHNLAFTFLGIICITLPLCFFISIPFFPVGKGIYHYQITLGYFFILWAYDTIAYSFGKHFGRHKLFERISPGKSWEGSCAGLIAALLIGWLCSFLFTIINSMNWMMIVLIIAVSGTVGDLIKSLMKRSLHIKDSGTILPGHGGMLDRFDTLLGSAPFVFCYLILFQNA